jgi:molybdopterin-guanine dinucleotide biosynthesis protein A
VIEVGPGYTSLVHVCEEPAGQGPLAAMAAGWAELTRAAEPGRLIEACRDPAPRGGAAAQAGGGRPAPGAVAAGGPGVLVVATDLPGLTVGLLRLLAGHPARGCVVPLDVAGHPQLLCARYPSFTLARASRLVEQGRRAVSALLDGEDVAWLTAQEWLAAAGSPAALGDVDTPADLARLTGCQVVRP